MTTIDTSIIDRMDYETFVNIIANIPSCIFFKDTDLRYQFSSHLWMQLTSNNIVGKTDLEVRKDQENAMKAMEADREIIRSQKGCRYTIKSDIDGEISYLELIKEPIIRSDGSVIGIVGLINDVTEKTMIEKKIVGMSEMLEVQCRELESSNEELKATLDKVEKMYDAQSMFTASMNHELRSPLNGIIGSIESIMDDDNLTPAQRETLSGAYQSSTFMLDIVNDLLDYAKVEMSELTIKHEPFSLSGILAHIHASTKSLADAKGLSFEIEKAPHMPDILIGDGMRLRQIMFNFTSNAVKYTEKGRITLSVASEDNRLFISCTDTGQGIAQDAIESLFDPFTRFQEKKNARIQGTGLGLYVVKKIIESMNGEIRVKSALNSGSTFIAIIPMEIPAGEICVPDIDYRNHTLEEHISSEAEQIDFSTLTALCVDDSTVNAKVIAALLTRAGMKVDTAYSAKEGIEKADLHPYDIIFMDHLMPEMDGTQAFCEIRKYSLKNKNTPVIMLTGNADPDSIALYQKFGFDGYLTKPVFRDRLLETVRKTVKK